MSGRLIRRSFAAQPQSRVNVDKSVWPGRSQIVLPSLGYAGVIGGDGSGGLITGTNANVPFSWTGPSGRRIAWRPNSSTDPGEFYTWTAGDFNVGPDASFIALLSPTAAGSLPATVEYGGVNWGLNLAINSNATSVSAYYVDDPTTNEYGVTLSSLPTFATGVTYPVGLVKRGTSITVYFGGQMATASGGNGGIRRSAGSGIGFYESRVNVSIASASLVAITSEALSHAQMFALLGSVQAPWRIFEARPIWVPSSAAGGSHDATGALTADAAEVAGTAVHLTLHTATGALEAQAATVAATALHPHTATGALTAQSAEVAGTAARTLIHTSTGALASDSAVVAGSATRLALHTSTGSLASGDAVVAGDSEHSVGGEFAAAGSLVASSAEVAGTAVRLALHVATGALTAQDASVEGTAARLAAHTSEGAIAAGPATIAGTATRLALHTSDGALAAGAATIAGTANHPTLHDSTGDLEAGSATVSGTASLAGARVADGALAADVAEIVGIAARWNDANAALAAAIWGHTLSNGMTAGDTLAAMLEQMSVVQPVDIRYVNGVLITGTGVPPDHWRPA